MKENEKNEYESEVLKIIEPAIKKGYAGAVATVPQFCDTLFLWCHNNKSTEAFAAFLREFVTAAVLETLEYIVKEGGDGEEE